MYDEWYRMGNFYIKKEPAYYSHHETKILKNMVIFRNKSGSVTIMSIDIYHYYNGVTSVGIYPSIFHRDRIFNIFKDKFKNETTIVGGDIQDLQLIRISFEPGSDLIEAAKKFIEILASLNVDQRVEFPKLIFEEFTRIFNFINNTPTIPEHVISREDPSLRFVNPFLKKSLKLLKYLDSGEPVETLKVAQLLASGEDPNQMDFNGNSPLHSVISRSCQYVDIFQLLLYYKADVNRRPFATPFQGNPIEFTKTYNRPVYFKVIMYRDFGLRVSLSEPKVVVRQLRVESKDNQIFTSLTFTNNMSICSRMVTSARFNGSNFSSEQQAVFNLFCEEFEDPMGDNKKLKEAFHFGFGPESNKWIDIISETDSKKVIGFVSYQLLKQKTRIVVKTEYVAIQKGSILRRCGGAFFGRRAGFAIKFLKNKSLIQGYFLAISYLSFQAMEEELCTPKYQSAPLLKSNQEIVDAEDPTKKVVIVNGYYIEDRDLPRVKYVETKSLEAPKKAQILQKDIVGTKDTPPKKPGIAPSRKPFNEDCFEKFILWMSAGNKPKFTRGAVVSTLIGRRAIENYRDRVYANLGMNVVPHLVDLAGALLENRNEFLPLFKGEKLPNKADLEKALQFFQMEDEVFFGDPQAKL